MSKTWPVSLNNSSFDRAGITKDCQDAVCEYIWNGFEAGASNVNVSMTGEPLKENISIVIEDNGTGINYENFEESFGTFLSSAKNGSSFKLKSQSNKGKGRFSYLSFSPNIEWHTTYEENDQFKEYIISTSSVDRTHFDTTTPTAATKEHTGTIVSIPIYDRKTNDRLSFLEIKKKLLEEFSWFLYLNRDKHFILNYMGNVLDISEYINTELSQTISKEISDTLFKIDVVVWKNNVSNSSKIYYVTERGEIVNAQNTSFNKNKVNFYHAVFVTSAFFKTNTFFPDDNDNQAILESDEQKKERETLKALNKFIKEQVSIVLRQFLVLQADVQLSNMKSRGSYPKFSDDEYGSLRKADFETVTRELYCVEPRLFHNLNNTQERSLLGFLNLLLSSDERENILVIVEQMVNLTPEQRKNFAQILQRSKLQYIIDAISIIEHRVAVVQKLKEIVFDSVAFANERDHIQKLIEQHFWLFGEQYHLLTADKNLATSLSNFEKIVSAETSEENSSMSGKEARQRIDIFLYTQRIQENNTSEMLIIELKAPHVKLSLDVFNQIVRYANTLRKEPRFNSSNRIWRFFAICSEVEDDVKVKYENFKQHGKNGLADIIGNFELYALSWDDVFQAFENRHSYMLNKLRFDYSQVTKELGFDETPPDSRDSVSELTSQLLEIEAM